MCVCACLSSITGAGRAAEKFSLAVALSNMRERLLDVVVAIRNHSVNRVRPNERCAYRMPIQPLGGFNNITIGRQPRHMKLFA